MIDVHPPHEPVHGWRDFLLHLLTITIGLLIALSLEGCVEWQHHRHLVHEAETSLHTEIESNAKDMPDSIADLHKQQDILKRDVKLLKYIVKNQKAPDNSSMEITFHIRSFDDVSWKTAQSTSALSYMHYSQAEEYAGIYDTQNALYAAEQQAARDATISLAPFLNTDDKSPDPTEGQADTIRQKVEVLQGQLLLVDAFMSSLDREYKKFLAAHPN
ncbi:hypothetical protein [Granulicella sp. S190]|uniref:hypothetical protein n=1 Tax=Granulicella sp. S190 TaxID=1747226 RepID=UPI0020B15004|nr:hypothetical protein [Granulicella sp. S190]